MEKSEILNLETRRRIYNYIKENPGLHLRELARRLNLSYYNLDYHINYLKKLDLVEVKTENSYSRIYVSNIIGTEEKAILNVFQQKVPRFILTSFLIFKVRTQKELSEDLEKHPTTIKFHLKKLVDLGVVELAESHNGIVYINNSRCNKVKRSPIKNETLYKIKDYDYIKKVLITHSISLYNDKIFKEIIEWARDLTIHVDKARNGKGPKYFKLNKNFIEEEENLIIGIMSEIFPHPYYAGSWVL